MATFVQTNVGLYWGSYSLASTFNAVGLTLSSSLAEDTVYGDTTVSNAGGLTTVSLEGEGYWDSTTDGILDATTGLSASNQLVTVTPVDQSVGSPALFSQYQTAEYNPFSTGTVGEMLAFRVSGESVGQELVHGEIMVAPGTTRTSNSNSDSNQLGAVSATQTVYSALHVLTVSGSSPTLDVVVKSDNASGFSSPTTQLTHTQATAITSELKSKDGAITDDYWRVYWTVGGGSPQFDFICSIGII
tara:strand:+ start:3742 stop:4476 length:735 start_codon:yes stop_codon:yes gene_type:complete